MILIRDVDIIEVKNNDYYKISHISDDFTVPKYSHEKAKAEGRTEINFDEVDTLVLEKAKRLKVQFNLSTRLRRLAEDNREVFEDMKIIYGYKPVELIWIAEDLEKLANELEKENE